MARRRGARRPYCASPRSPCARQAFVSRLWPPGVRPRGHLAGRPNIRSPTAAWRSIRGGLAFDPHGLALDPQRPGARRLSSPASPRQPGARSSPACPHRLALDPQRPIALRSTAVLIGLAFDPHGLALDPQRPGARRLCSATWRSIRWALVLRQAQGRSPVSGVSAPHARCQRVRRRRAPCAASGSRFRRASNAVSGGARPSTGSGSGSGRIVHL
jgi:hypothetical protein